MTTTNETAEITKERKLDELLNLPYSELSEDELERVIEYRAQIKARDTLYRQTLESINKTGQKLYNEAKTQRENAENAQNTLLELSLKRLAQYE